MSKCVCEQPATETCEGCKRMVCDDCNCGTETVEGFLCGTYTQWGCARKFTTCDDCMDDLAIHEKNMYACGCGSMLCHSCYEEHICTEKDEEESQEQEQEQSQEQEQ